MHGLPIEDKKGSTKVNDIGVFKREEVDFLGKVDRGQE